MLWWQFPDSHLLPLVGVLIRNPKVECNEDNIHDAICVLYIHIFVRNIYFFQCLCMCPVMLETVCFLPLEPALTWRHVLHNKEGGAAGKHS